MKRTFMCGLAAIVGLVTMAGAAMAHHADFDVMTMDLQPEVGTYELTLLPDGADLLMVADVLAEVDVVPDAANAALVAFQTASMIEPMAVRGSASATMADDGMRLWRVRAVDAFTVSPDLLI